jgi:hypothetical protein
LFERSGGLEARANQQKKAHVGMELAPLQD